MTRPRVFAVAAFVVVHMFFARASSAQSSLPDNEWRHGTTLSISAGSAVAPSADARATLGGGFSWEIRRRFSLEGSGAWLVPRHDDEGFAADLTALVNLTRPARAVPFVGAGVGLYVASFDTKTGPLPDFYRARVPTDSAITQRTFTDPSFVFTGGVDILATAHLSVRPNVALKLVTDGSSVYPVTIAAVHVAYHFEVHHIVR